jgi:uncharacterized protein YfaS (alpha-2-macroglobulin family)
VHFGFVRIPARVGATLFLTEAEPVHFPRWAECFSTPRPTQRSEDREQNHRIDAVLSLTESSAIVWVMHKDKRTPIANQEVLFYLKDARESIEEKKVMTDNNGVASLSNISYWQLGAKISLSLTPDFVRPSPSKENVSHLNRMDGEGRVRQCLYLTHQNEISTGGRGQDAARIYALLPRPLYKPGEMVDGVLIARTKSGDTPSKASRIVEMVVIKNPKGAIMTTIRTSFNSFGVANFSMQLSKEAALGKYTFAFVNTHTNAEIEGSFYVEEFVAPEFRAGLSARPSDWRQPLLVSFEASYFFGGPVADASGTLEIVRNDWRYRLHSEWPPPKDHQRSKTLAPISFTTNKDGKAEIKIPWSSPWFVRTDGCSFRCKARLRDASGKTCEAELSVSRSKLGAIMKATPVSSMCLPEEEIELSVQRHRESSA